MAQPAPAPAQTAPPAPAPAAAPAPPAMPPAPPAAAPSPAPVNPGEQPPAQPGAPASGGQTLSAADEQALKRYQYMLQTAPPDQIEKAHEEAFAKLTPEQRKELLARLSKGNPADKPADDSPQALARSATRTEMREPGSLQKVVGGEGAGMGKGGAALGMGAALLGGVAAGVVGTAVFNSLFDENSFQQWDSAAEGLIPDVEIPEVGDFFGFDGDSGGGFFDDF
ncbi:hypothetical protein SAMN05421595_1857 [Austwickia chelonae]|nr:hypothetical protein [Austwickia chelonae]SEW29809.1 hypothetical protein SAMN05421595_1857 [Austwickia chelonae]